MFPLYDDNPTRGIPFWTILLIVANLGIYGYEQSLPPAELNRLVMTHGFIPARLTDFGAHPQMVLVEDGVRVVVPNGVRDILLTMLSCMFLHGSWMHVIGNVWFLWLFGNNVEDRLGVIRFPLLYLGGGIAASLVHYVTGPNSTVPVVGASGAISAVLGAYAVTWPTARVKTLVVLIVIVFFVDLPALLVLGFWFVQQILSTLASGESVEGVAWWAHIGGFVVGMALMPLLRSPPPPPEFAPHHRFNFPAGSPRPWNQ